jgi:hypothetical protein
MGGGGGSSSSNLSPIRIPTLAAGSASDSGDGAIGSPGQNAQGGMDTQPGGAPPWWSTPPAWWRAAPSGGESTADVGGNSTLQRSASAGRVQGKTAAELAAEPAGGWATPPVFQQTAPDKVIDTTGGKDRPGNVGVVNPRNVLVGYSNPKTGVLEQTPNGGPAIWR